MLRRGTLKTPALLEAARSVQAVAGGRQETSCPRTPFLLAKRTRMTPRRAGEPGRVRTRAPAVPQNAGPRLGNHPGRPCYVLRNATQERRRCPAREGAATSSGP